MLSNRTRIAAPFVVSGLIAAGVWLPTLRASASPDLPTITPQHLVEKVLGEKVSHLSGTFEWQADLGLPSLSGLTGSSQGVAGSSGFDPTSLLSGTQTFKVWTDGANRQRVASLGSLSETDLVRNGDQAWLYDSSTNHVTHYVPARARMAGRGMAGRGMAGRGMGDRGMGDRGMGSDFRYVPGTEMGRIGVTQLADSFLSGVRSGGSTVTTGRPVEVAGRAAYLLRIAPDRTIAANRVSTVTDVTVAVDAHTGLPLRVSVYAVGQSAPALQVGWSSISYGTPSASMFAAPVGGSTSTKTISAPRVGRLGARPARIDWSGSTRLHQVKGSEQVAAQDQGVGTRWGEGPVTMPAQSPERGDGAAPGADWGSIHTLSSGIGSSAAGGEIDSVTTVVTGSWGSGRLLQSSLVNALFLDSGKVLVGLVTPAALEAAAGHIQH